MLVGSNGNVTSIRDYDASGQIMLKAPDIDKDRDPFGFIVGLSSGNGLWKLGTRFYDSGKNSFIQQDRYMGDPKDPLSLNRYVHVIQNFTRFGMKPLGHLSVFCEKVSQWFAELDLLKSVLLFGYMVVV